MNKNYWSEWRNINEARQKERGKFGVYQINIVDEKHNPFPIPRFTGIDNKGIVYIGRAKPNLTLASRIERFRKTSLTLTKGDHTGGETLFFVKTNLDKLKHNFRKYRLQYRVSYIEPSSFGSGLQSLEAAKQGTESRESYAMADYFKKYCELPPCNATFPG